MELICSCQDPSVTYTEYGGGFTKTEISNISGLICIRCSKCIAIQQYEDYYSLQELLQDTSNHKKGWIQAQSNDDLYKHKLLNFIVYRINEPPNKETFECNYSEPIKGRDQIHLLWHQSKASGFITIRPYSEAFEDSNLSIIDTVYIQKSARGHGFLSKFLAAKLNNDDSNELGFSDPISNSMLIVLMKLLKKNPNQRERIWLVNEENGERQILWWSAMKIARQRNIDLKSILK